MSRRVYLAGECSSEWLGCDWRQVYALTLRAAGLEPVWPPLLSESLVGDRERCARARGLFARTCRQAMRACIACLASCDAVLVRVDEREGTGTACEIAYASSCGIPVVAHRCAVSRFPDLAAAIEADEHTDLEACVTRLAALLSR